MIKTQKRDFDKLKNAINRTCNIYYLLCKILFYIDKIHTPEDDNFNSRKSFVLCTNNILDNFIVDLMTLSVTYLAISLVTLLFMCLLSISPMTLLPISSLTLLVMYFLPISSVNMIPISSVTLLLVIYFLPILSMTFLSISSVTLLVIFFLLISSVTLLTTF